MTLEIRMLGEFSVIHRGNKLALTKSKRTRALLAYLAMTNRPKRRDHLCELLWDDHNDPKHALRWSLSKIRHFVNEEGHERLIADRERVTLFTNEVLIDVHAIKNSLDNLDIAVDELKHHLTALESSFLEGFDITSQSAFQRWLVAERIEAERLFLEVLKRLWDHPNTRADDKLSYMKIGLAKEPYNINIGHALLTQLSKMGFTGEKEKTQKALMQQFNDAGIKWQPIDELVLKNAASPFSNEQVASRELLMRQQIKFCSTQDSTRIAYASIGKGYPIIKAANWLTHLEYDWNAPIWSPLFRKLASEYQVVRYDERGNGLSDWEVDDLSFDAFVDDLDTVVNKTQLKKFALLGISQGASVSIQYAINHPEKVSHLILFGAYVAGWRINASVEEIKRREAIITLTQSGWGQDNPAYRQIFSSTFMPSANKEEFDWFNEFQRQTTSPENAARFLSVFGDIDVRHQLAKLNVPTLVIHSLGDQRIPVEVAQDIASQIPNAEFVGLRSDGHLLLGREAASEVFVETVKDFIARH